MSTSTQDYGAAAGGRPWMRVTRSEPCAICHGADWCEYASCPDCGGVDHHCMRPAKSQRADGLPMEHRQGGMLFRHECPSRAGRGSTHPTARLAPTAPPRPVVPAPPAIPRADRATCDQVYRRLFALCGLSAAHHAHLTGPKRQLADDDLAGYASLPANGAQASLIAALVKTFGGDTLLGVPGFTVHREGNDEHLRINAGRGALLIGYDDDEGYRQSVQCRTDDGAYYALSSSKKGGPTAEAHAHVVAPIGADPLIVLVTEGGLKAHIAARRTGRLTIGVPGHTNWAAGMPVLERLRARGAAVLILALDADDPDNKPDTVKDVERSRGEWAVQATELGYCVLFARWDNAQGKGIDDLLLNGHTFSCERYVAPAAEAQDDEDTSSSTASESGVRRYGVPTLDEALALPHRMLARRYVAATERAYAGDTYLDLIARGTKHAAVITPADDPTAKRRRPVLAATDRVFHANTVLNIRAAHKGKLSTEPVPLYRAAIAANAASDTTVTSGMAQVARVGLIAQTGQQDEQGRNLYALPPVMPHEIAHDDLLTFDSPRRTTERQRPCPSCGGTEFARTTRVRITCSACGDIIKDTTHTVKLSDYDDTAAAEAAAAGMTTQETPPLANCNTQITSTDGKEGATHDRYRDLA